MWLYWLPSFYKPFSYCCCGQALCCVNYRKLLTATVVGFRQNMEVVSWCAGIENLFTLAETKKLGLMNGCIQCFWKSCQKSKQWQETFIAFNLCTRAYYNFENGKKKIVWERFGASTALQSSSLACTSAVAAHAHILWHCVPKSAWVMCHMPTAFLFSFAAEYFNSNAWLKLVINNLRLVINNLSQEMLRR